jgi:hypothetical protein
VCKWDRAVHGRGRWTFKNYRMRSVFVCLFVCLFVSKHIVIILPSVMCMLCSLRLTSSLLAVSDVEYLFLNGLMFEFLFFGVRKAIACPCLDFRPHTGWFVDCSWRETLLPLLNNVILEFV